MTYLEYRQKLSELSARHSAERNALTAQYNADHTVDAKRARRLEAGAQQWLISLRQIAPGARTGVPNTVQDVAEIQRACELDPRFAYDRIGQTVARK